MVNFTQKFLPALVISASVLASMQANACTISEDMLDSVPLNSIEIPNSDRLKIADMVYNAKQWPDAEIRGIVTAGAYIKESNPTQLSGIRGKNIRDYLIQLGLKSEKINIEKHTIKTPYPKDSTGMGGLLQIGVTLVPICNGGCERLCNDPRVTPNSKAIK